MSKRRKDCLFCKVYDINDGIVYEDQYFYARFDRFPITPGHLEIIPKRHVESVFDLTDDEASVLHHALKRVKALIEKCKLQRVYTEIVEEAISESSVQFCRSVLSHPGLDAKPDGYNIGINDGPAAGRSVHHLHVHVIPRYFGDVENPRGGVRHIIPGKGDY